MSPAPPIPLAILGLPIGAGPLISLLLKSVTAWVAAGTGTLVQALGAVLTATTEPPLGAAFEAELGLVARLSAALVPLFLVAAVIEAVLRQEFSALFRAVVLRAPIALLGSGVAIEAVLLLMRATDALSRAALSLAATPAQSFVDGLSSALLLSGAPIIAPGFEAVLFAVLLSAVALLLWLELALRGAAIAVALLFVPLALAGVVFPATAHWPRRLAETLVALVASKLVIACVLALGVSSIGEPQDASGFVEGVALLLLAALSPFALLKLVPAVEAGAIGHLEGLGRRAVGTGRGALGMIPLPGEGLSGGDGAVGLAASAIPLLPGSPLSGPEFDQHLERVRGELFGSLSSSPGSAGSSPDDGSPEAVPAEGEAEDGPGNA